MFTRFLSVLALTGVAVLATGCDQGTNKPVSGRVAIIDLDRVAKDLGWKDDMDRSIGTVDQELSRQLQSLRAELQQQLEQRKKDLGVGENPTPEQKEKLDQVVRAANARMQQAMQQAQQEAGRFRANLIIQYRDEIKPVARRVAEGNGYTAVMVTDPNMVLYVHADADITNKVIDELQKTKGPRTVAVPQPYPVPVPSTGGTGTGTTTRPSTGLTPPTTQPR